MIYTQLNYQMLNMFLGCDVLSKVCMVTQGEEEIFLSKTNGSNASCSGSAKTLAAVQLPCHVETH